MGGFDGHWGSCGPGTPTRSAGSGRLTVAVQYRGQPLTIEVADREVTVCAAPGPGPAVRVGCGVAVRDLEPGQSACFRAG